jgi:hypothetical protein
MHTFFDVFSADIHCSTDYRRLCCHRQGSSFRQSIGCGYCLARHTTELFEVLFLIDAQALWSAVDTTDVRRCDIDDIGHWGSVLEDGESCRTSFGLKSTNGAVSCCLCSVGDHELPTHTVFTDFLDFSTIRKQRYFRAFFSSYFSFRKTPFLDDVRAPPRTIRNVRR